MVCNGKEIIRIMKTWNEYYMDMLPLVAQRSSCIRHQIAAILTKNDHILATGYNGTPHGILNCNDGGCIRCASDIAQNLGYDFCSCLHAEENILLDAAITGISVVGCVVYTTFRPCIGCLRKLIQCRIKIVYYGGDWDFSYNNSELENFHQSLIKQSGIEMVWMQTDEPA